MLLTGKYTSYADAFDAAKESLISGKAYGVLKNLVAIQ
jgi:hypothetical protein